MSGGKLCVWRSNEKQQFVRLKDLVPANGSFAITLDTASIYSISTTTGQQKGAYPGIPSPAPFPFPYKETFEAYKNAATWGYLPHYTADIAGVFEISERPDNKGKCLRQVIKDGSQSWAPEWTPYTILGDSSWKDYEVTADVSLDSNGWAGVMGRMKGTGTGYGTKPDGYYMSLSADGAVALYVSKHEEKMEMGTLLAKAIASGIRAGQWHTIMLRFSGNSITGFVDDNQVLSANDSAFASGMAGLLTGSKDKAHNTALFDNLIIGPVNGTSPAAHLFADKVHPMYK